MSDDLVRRLREGVWGRARRADAVIHAAMQDGADRIEAQAAEIARLRAALATARQEGMEMPPEFLQWVTREMPSGTEIHDPYWWAQRIWAAAIRALKGEGDE